MTTQKKTDFVHINSVHLSCLMAALFEAIGRYGLAYGLAAGQSENTAKEYILKHIADIRKHLDAIEVRLTESENDQS